MAYGQAVVLKDENTGVQAIITSKGLKVDTEMTLSGDVTIENVTIARDDAGNEKKLRVDNNKNLYVTVPTDAPLNVSGDSLAAIQDAVEIMDDWDESDRAKVNPVVGQAGVAADVGKSSNITQRTTLATDDPIGTQISGDTAKLVKSLDSEAGDELRVHVSDPTTPANRQTVYSSGAARISGDVNLVNADIQIGAVELKDGDSDTRADIENDGTKNALYIQANNLDVRDLVSTSDSIEAKQSTATDLKAQINIDPTDQVATQISGDTASIKTSVELLDNAVDGNYLDTNMNIAGNDISANAGKLTAQTQRITIATDDAPITQISGDTAKLVGALDSENSDELRVHISDKTTPTNKATVYSTGAVRVSGDVNLVNSDIQIGSVELKDGDSDTRADIETDSSKNALFVQSESLANKTIQALMSGDLNSLNGKDFATEVTLAKIKGALDSENSDEFRTLIYSPSGDTAKFDSLSKNLIIQDPTFKKDVTVTVPNGSANGETDVTIHGRLTRMIFKIPALGVGDTAELKLQDTNNENHFTTGELAESTSHLIHTSLDCQEVVTFRVECSGDQVADATFNIYTRGVGSTS